MCIPHIKVTFMFEKLIYELKNYPFLLWYLDWMFVDWGLFQSIRKSLWFESHLLEEATIIQKRLFLSPSWKVEPTNCWGDDKFWIQLWNFPTNKKVSSEHVRTLNAMSNKLKSFLSLLMLLYASYQSELKANFFITSPIVLKWKFLLLCLIES